MSNDNDGDFSFNELIDNILTSNNDNNNSDNENKTEENTHKKSQDVKKSDDDQKHSHPANVELPDFADEEDDLVAAVANAMQDIQGESDLAHNDKHIQHEALPAAKQHNDHMQIDDEDQQQHSEWAQILQQGLLQEEEHDKIRDQPVHSNAHTNIQHVTHNDNIHTHDDQLDREDEHLRMAILESLQNFNNEGDETSKGEHIAVETEKSKKSSKKSSKKKKKDKSKTKDSEKDKSSSKKKKSTKHSKKDKDKSKEKDNADELDFNDVISGLIEQGEHTVGSELPIAGQKIRSTAQADSNDAETQALVEETLKAFERELLGSSTEGHKPHGEKKSITATLKTKSSEKTKQKESIALTSKKQSKSDSSKKKKKKKSSKAADKSTQDAYIDDDFSKVLADMVSQVVSTSLTEESGQPDANDKSGEAHQDIIRPNWNHNEFAPNDEELNSEVHATNDEPFDLNQIMQNAMAMAFQEQNDNHFDSSAMEEFNRSLGNFNVSDLMSTGQTTGKAKSTKKKSGTKKKKLDKAKSFKDREIVIHSLDEKKKPKVPKKPSRPQPSPEQVHRKKYKAVVNEAARLARKRNKTSRRDEKQRLKDEHDKLRSEKKLRKKEEVEKQVTEQKDLAEVVARGPPYPVDLRVTKKGKPKKPYRRWTTEEMFKRAQMVLQKPEKPVKVKKERKKKTKKLKRIPLATLKKIPLFNFVKGNVSIRKKELNDIEGTISKIPLASNEIKYEYEKDENNSYDISSKTTVHKEKIAFHPPWTIPTHPPFRLPVARRRPKDKRTTKRSGSHSRSRHSHNSGFDSLLNSSSRVLPSALIAIITTLKTAAKTRIANGASQDETLRYLMTIVERTKKSIADVVSRRNISGPSRMGTMKSAGTNTIVKSENAQSTKKIPIFSLANIKQIQEKAAVDEQKLNMPKVMNIKQEVHLETVDLSSGDESKTQPIDEEDADMDSEDKTEDSEKTNQVVPNEIKSSQVSTEQSQNSLSRTEIISINLYGALIGPQFSHHPDLSLSTSSPVMEPSRKREREETDDITTTKEVIEVKDEDDSRQIPLETSHKPSIAKAELVTRPSYVKVEHMVESLVKQELKESNDDIKLPSSLSRIITSTISNLIPNFKKQESKEKSLSTNRNRVLNLDGLVPPGFPVGSPLSPIPKGMIVPRQIPRFKIEKKKLAEKALMYTFNIPDFSGLPGKRNILLKKAKILLTDEDQKTLNRELNRERKRKWREANVAKNWEHDFRSRTKKRANIMFSEADSEEKNKWMEEEFKIKCKESGYTPEDFATTKSASENVKVSFMSDQEILNIIATTVNKLDVARKLEDELNNEMRVLCEPKSKPPAKRRKLNAK